MSEAGSIYIHVPFCVQKCRYCDFFSSTRLQAIPDYVDALKKEISRAAVANNPRITSLNTLYFGGGTPSVLSVSQVEEIINGLNRSFPLSERTEITFEVNPGTVAREYLESLQRLGINRLSIGVQSFLPEKLAFLERLHDAEQAENAIVFAKDAGFENISMDLMYGLAFEDEAMWMQDLETAIEKDVQHLSCYMLTVEPSTRLGREVEQGKVPEADPEIVSSLFKKTSLFLEAEGYGHYEISNFAKGRQYRSQHNSTYWNMSPYLGLGPAAHSFDGKTRWWNPKSVSAWMSAIQTGKVSTEGSEDLTQGQRMLEMLMLRFRTSDGLNLDQFEKMSGQSFEQMFKKPLLSLFNESLGKIENNRFSLNLEGKIRLNSILDAFARQVI